MCQFTYGTLPAFAMASSIPVPPLVDLNCSITGHPVTIVGLYHKELQMSLMFICYLIATILAFLAAFGISSSKFNTGWGALAFVALAMTLAGFGLR